MPPTDHLSSETNTSAAVSQQPAARKENDRVRPLPNRPRGAYSATVVRNVRICTDHFRLTLGLENFPPSEPGQFVQIECDDEGTGAGGNGGQAMENEPVSFEWGPGAVRPKLLDPDFAEPLAYLRRPFSIAGRRNGANGIEIDVIHRVVGRGTKWLEALQPGQNVSVLGPLGKGFWIPETMKTGLLVGGGVGIPPMFYLAEAMHQARRDAIGFVGAQRSDLVPVTFAAGSAEPSAAGEPVLNATEFSAYGFPTVVATDNGSMGMKGFVTEALRKCLQKLKANSELGVAVVFCCGPTPMMKATAKVCAEFGVLCEVSLEQPMACGMGTCQSCVIKWKGPAGNSEVPASAVPEWKYKLTCTDGPVFDSRELLW